MIKATAQDGLITLQPEKRTCGYFSAARFASLNAARVKIFVA